MGWNVIAYSKNQLARYCTFPSLLNFHANFSNLIKSQIQARSQDCQNDEADRSSAFVRMFDAGKTRMIGLPYGEKTVTIC